MSVLPLFVPMKLQSLPPVVNSIFKNVQEILETRSVKGPNPSAAKMARSAFATILTLDGTGVLCDPSYFSRVWTLVCAA